MTADFLLINKIIVVLINAIGLPLAFWVYFSNRIKKINIFFFLCVTTLLLWIDFEFICILSPFLNIGGSELSLFVFAKRLAYGSLCLFFIFVHLFSFYFPKETKKNRLFDEIYITVWLILFLFSIFTSWIIKGAEWKESAIERMIGDGIFVLYFFALFSVLLIFYKLFKKYFALEKKEKLKFKYLLIGSFFLGFFTLLFNIIFPIVGIDKFNQFGHYSVIFLFIFTSYAIVKKELFEMKVIFIQLLVGIIAIILLAIPFLIDIFWIKILLLFLFFLFCIFGRLLIKSTLKEVGRKEILERKVKERTDELEKTRKKLEEAKTVLEIKVKARTKELNEFTEDLEGQIEKRTKEFQERVEELEKFHKITVGRELKMIELKKEIKKMKEAAKDFKKKN